MGDLRSHDVLKAVDELLAGLKKARRTEAGEVAENHEQLVSFEIATAYIKEKLLATPSGLFPSDAPDAIHSQLTPAISQINEFTASGNTGQLPPTGQNLDKALRTLAQFPPLAAGAEASAAAKAFDSARKSMRGYVGGLKTQINRLEKRTTAAATKAAEIDSEVQSQKGRVDTLVTEHQAAFTQAQEQRTQANTAFIDQQRQRFDAALKDVDALYDDHSGRLEASWTSYQQEVARHSDSAEKLLEALGVTSQSAAFLTSANREMWTARTWHALAVAALLGLIYVAVFQILPSLIDPFEWEQFGGRVFVGATLLATASYAGAQAGKHAQREEYYRNMHLQLAALDPYLSRLPQEQRDQIKASLAPTLFKVPVASDVELQRANLLEDVMKVVLKALGSSGGK